VEAGVTLGLPVTVLVGRVTVSVRIVAGGATEEVALEQDDGEVRETEEGPLETEGDVEAPLWLEGERGRPEDLAVSTWRGDLAVRTRRGSSTTQLDVDEIFSPSFDLPIKDFSFPCSLSAFFMISGKYSCCHKEAAVLFM